jgi:hypothetical protein
MVFGRLFSLVLGSDETQQQLRAQYSSSSKRYDVNIAARTALANIPVITWRSIVDKDIGISNYHLKSSKEHGSIASEERKT